MSAEPRSSVLFADSFYMTEESLALITKSAQIVELKSSNGDLLSSQLQSANPQVIISEYFGVTKQVMDDCPNLKGIIVWGVGYNHVDVEAASERGIFVANTATSNSESVAEHAFALILCLGRKVVLLDTLVKGGRWSGKEEVNLPSALRTHDLSRKTIGIVGMGNIGRRLANMAIGLGMRVIFHDPYVQLSSVGNIAMQPVHLEQLLRESDFISLHVTLTQETTGMIGAKELRLMKPTAVLVNTSRGPVIDEAALVNALRNRQIAGAGLDVFDSEPIRMDNPLVSFENVILTPHCAGNSQEALDATAWSVATQAVKILDDEPPDNLVNRKQLRRMR